MGRSVEVDELRMMMEGRTAAQTAGQQQNPAARR